MKQARQYIHICSSVRSIITKNTKVKINVDHRKNDHPRGPPGHSDGEKGFLSHDKKHKRGKISTIGKITTQGGTLGPAEVGKKFGSNFWRTTYIFGADMRSLSQKMQNYIKFKPSKN